MNGFAALMYGFAGFSGVVVVALSALAAHGLVGIAPTGEQAVVWFREATAFQMTHTIALILATMIAERLAAGSAQKTARARGPVRARGGTVPRGALFRIVQWSDDVCAPRRLRGHGRVGTVHGQRLARLSRTKRALEGNEFRSR